MKGETSVALSSRPTQRNSNNCENAVN